MKTWEVISEVWNAEANDYTEVHARYTARRCFVNGAGALLFLGTSTDRGYDSLVAAIPAGEWKHVVLVGE